MTKSTTPRSGRGENRARWKLLVDLRALDEIRGWVAPTLSGRIQHLTRTCKLSAAEEHEVLHMACKRDVLPRTRQAFREGKHSRMVAKRSTRVSSEKTDQAWIHSRRAGVREPARSGSACGAEGGTRPPARRFHQTPDSSPLRHDLPEAGCGRRLGRETRVLHSTCGELRDPLHSHFLHEEFEDHVQAFRALGFRKEDVCVRLWGGWNAFVKELGREPKPGEILRLARPDRKKAVLRSS